MMLITPSSSIDCWNLPSTWPWEASDGIFMLLHGKCWRNGGQAAASPQLHSITLLQAQTTLPPASSLGPSNPIHSPSRDLPTEHIWSYPRDSDHPWLPLSRAYNPHFLKCDSQVPWRSASLLFLLPQRPRLPELSGAWTSCQTFHMLFSLPVILSIFAWITYPMSFLLISSSLRSMSPLWALLQTLSEESPTRLKHFRVKDCFFPTATSPLPSTEMAWDKYLWDETSEWMNKRVNAWVITCHITNCPIFLIRVCKINWINEGGKPAIGIPGEEWTLARELRDHQVLEKQRETLCRKWGVLPEAPGPQSSPYRGLGSWYPQTSHPIPTHYSFQSCFPSLSWSLQPYIWTRAKIWTCGAPSQEHLQPTSPSRREARLCHRLKISPRECQSGTVGHTPVSQVSAGWSREATQSR